jgi:hypothetical protein
MNLNERKGDSCLNVIYIIAIAHAGFTVALVGFDRFYCIGQIDIISDCRKQRLVF